MGWRGRSLGARGPWELDGADGGGEVLAMDHVSRPRAPLLVVSPPRRDATGG